MPCFATAIAAAGGRAILTDPDLPSGSDRIFQALSEKGTVQMPIQKTFWALRFGTLTDQLGVPWMINCEAPMQ